jgi:accessory gene regulator protein AgrB
VKIKTEKKTAIEVVVVDVVRFDFIDCIAFYSSLCLSSIHIHSGFPLLGISALCTHVKFKCSHLISLLWLALSLALSFTNIVALQAGCSANRYR